MAGAHCLLMDQLPLGRGHGGRVGLNVCAIPSPDMEEQWQEDAAQFIRCQQSLGFGHLALAETYVI